MTVWKEPADVATTETLGAGPSFPASGVVDGVVLKVGNRVLVKDQLTSTENGYYEVSVGVPPTLIATGDTIEAEDVIRVSQGDRNAHTAWALIDTTSRIFVRQDTKHYSLNSIYALKHLWQVLPDATATVASYAEPGDMGGGDFRFVGVPKSAQVLSATAVSTSINAVTNVGGLVTITASTPHGLGDPGNVTTTFISGVTGMAYKAYSITIATPDTFTINARIPTASNAAGAKVQYVRLVTFAMHGRATSQRISVSGVVMAGGAVDIRGVTDLCGVIDDTTLSIPIATSGGMYTPGSSAVIGDDGLSVPATDSTGAYGGLWERLRVGYFDVKWFGAKADWESGKDDLPAFVAALGAMAAGGRRTGKLVADGHFYLSDTLHLTQTILLEGTGQNEPERSDPSRCWPGTWLVFPKNVTGIRIRGGAGLDNPTKTFGSLFPPSGEKTVLRNLTLSCKDIEARAEAKECRDQEAPCLPEGDCIHGIHASSAVHLENVTVEYFAHDGIHIVGAECGKTVPDGDGNQRRVYDGNADGSYVENCSAGLCGRDGFHFSGGDAQVCVISRCSGTVNGRAGFYDATFGNTYLGCHSEGNRGPNYITELDINASVFLNCWSEGGSPPNQFHGQVTIISGKIGGHPDYMTEDSSAFILEHGVATRAPIVYKNLNTSAAKAIGVSLGDMSTTVQGPGTEMVAFQWATLTAADQNIEDRISLRYLDAPLAPPGVRGHGWWALDHNLSFYRHMIRFPTASANARLFAPWFVNGIFLGQDDLGPPKVSFTAAPNIPDSQDGVDPRTYEKGDVVWNSEPSPGGPIGQVCITSGTQDTLNPATFSTFGEVVNIGKSISYAESQALGIADRYVTVTVTGKTMTLPASPVDGQTHAIKSRALVTTTVDTAVDAAGGVLTIDGALTTTVAPLQNRTFRYSAATGEWEIR